jgi:hypothetical protein
MNTSENQQLNCKSYFDTTNENNIQYIVQAKKQNDIILNFFIKNPEREISASVLEYNQVLHEDTPLTSYRRALNTLMNAGKIQKVGKVDGFYGRKEFTYKIIL